jgi:glycosyltransferase involved in cell wall biosynthesis
MTLNDQPPLVSVVIPTRSRPHAVVEAVASVFAGAYQRFELFVIDQSPDDETRVALAGVMTDPRFHFHFNRRPGYGAASSRNIGIALSSGEIVAITDDDVAARPDWLEQIVAEFAADPDLDFVLGRLTAPPYDHEAGYIPEFCPFPELSKWRLPTVAAGANFSMRRRLFDRVGGYDEFCGPGSRLGASDDGDLSMRIAHSGAKWKACPHVEVIHVHGFRDREQTAALLRRYERGVGGNYGRAARRGLVLPAAWYLAREARDAARVGLDRLRGRRGASFAGSRRRLGGFVDGFKLSPHEGYVSGSDLRRMRERLGGAPLVDAPR